MQQNFFIASGYSINENELLLQFPLPLPQVLFFSGIIMLTGQCVESDDANNISKAVVALMHFIASRSGAGNSLQCHANTNIIINSLGIGNNDIVLEENTDVIKLQVKGKTYQGTTTNKFLWKANIISLI